MLFFDQKNELILIICSIEFKWLPIPKNPDPYLFKGAGVTCFVATNITGTAKTCEVSTLFF